jgi:hypothetical protein
MIEVEDINQCNNISDKSTRTTDFPGVAFLKSPNSKPQNHDSPVSWFVILNIENVE